MLCSHAKGVQGPAGTRSNLVGSHFVPFFFGDFDHAATASDIAAKARLLLLLMSSVIGEEAERHTHCSMVSTVKQFTRVLSFQCLPMLPLKGTRYPDCLHQYLKNYVGIRMEVWNSNSAAPLRRCCGIFLT